MYSITKKAGSLLISVTLSSFLSVSAQSEQEKITTLIDQRIEFNKANKNSIVYKIQLYNGTENSAFSKKRKFETLFPDLTAQVTYDEPEWKTQVGKFKTRLEADRIARIIKEEFPAVIVLEGQF